MMGNKKPKGERVHVATIQTACRRKLQDFASYKWIIIDECHRVRSKQYQKVLEQYPTQKILGATATPIRLDGKSLGTVFDEMVICTTPKELIQQNYLVPLKVFLPEKPIDLSKVKVDKKTKDYSTRSLGSLYAKPALIGNAIEHYKRYGNQRPALVYCTTIAHAEKVRDELNKAGIPAEIMTGSTPPTKRVELLEALQDKRIKALCNVQVLTEGVDAPKVSCLVILRPTLSKALHLQILGRGARTAPGKSDCIVLDHADNCRKHGLFDDDREWDLRGRQVKRGRGRGFAADQVKRCPKCGHALPITAKHCPNCGLDWLPITAPGKLIAWWRNRRRGGR
jgi:superfamily II DNA or RNA helicase